MDRWMDLAELFGLFLSLQQVMLKLASLLEFTELFNALVLNRPYC